MQGGKACSPPECLLVLDDQETSILRYLRRSGLSTGVTFVAAYMLVLQALLGAFAMGAASASPMLDAFGHPLCITSGDQGDIGTGKDHTGLPDCCAPGCAMFAPITADDREPHALDNPLSVSFEISIMSPAMPVAGNADHDPGKPRAPPLAA